MIQRLFDIVAQRSNDDPNAIMLAAKENGTWRTYGCAEVWHTARRLAGGLTAAGISSHSLLPEQQEKVAIIALNRPEWMIVDIAVQLTGSVLTPIYPTVSPNDFAYILQEAGVQALFIANAGMYDHFKEAFALVPTLKHIYSFDDIPGVTSWKELLKDDLQPDENIISQIKPDTLATIIYTSGTTGDPKGVMLSHNNIVSNVNDSLPAFTFAKKHERALSFLPLNHIFERMVTYIYLISGISIYYAENMDTIGLNLKEVKPMVFTTVPRVLEKVYERIMTTGMELKGIKRALFFWALNLGKQYDNNVQRGSWYNFQLALANKLIFNKWREALGGNVKAIVSGSAACQVRLIRIFSAAQVIIMEGYGLTETSPVVSVNRYETDGRRMGTVGTLIDHVEVKLAEDGEILTKGPNIMMGYYKHPEMTHEAMKDGWFHTGDIGEWVDGKFLKITDRKKEIFKTSGGKYVAPQALENKMKESMFIEQMLVIGNGRKFVSALIVPSFMQLRKYIRDNYPDLSVPDDNALLIKQPQVIAQIQKQLDKYNPQFSHPEQIKKFTLLPDEWTIDGGELTPSLKTKRKTIEQKFATQIEDMYGNVAGE
jgi:long-chain acyl-CoA synthetase